MITLKKLSRVFDRATKIKLFALLIAIIIGGLIETLAIAMIMPFIELLLDDSMLHANPYTNWAYSFFGFKNTMTLLAFLAVSLSAVYIFRSVYLYVLERTKIQFSTRMQARYSKRLLTKILDFSYLYHTHKNIAEIQRIINDDVTEMFKMVTGVLLFLSDFFTTVFIMAYLFYQSPLMTLFVLGLTLICIALYFLIFRNKIRRAGNTTRKARIEMGKAVYQIFGGVKEVKVSKREEYFKDVFSYSRDIFVRSYNKFRALDILPKYTLEAICFGGSFALLGVFIFIGTDVSAFIPLLALFVMAAMRILPAITKQVKEINTVLFSRAAVDAVYASFFEEKDIAAPVSHAFEADNAGTSQSGNNADINIRNISFAYPGIEESVLEDVSFTIPENKSVALVGPSGAGKTTLADLILGVLTPDAGAVLYRGKPIHTNPGWSSTVGYIPQHIYLLDESILANVAFGIYKKDIDEDKAWRALEQAQLKSFVQSLPDGINTIIGDRGVRLSGGQRQRIGIARAIYEDPPVLVLDEATSSLDNETEAAVMDAIMGFHGNKTILIVAHRLSTIEHCDIVYRVEGKKIARER